MPPNRTPPKRDGIAGTFRMIIATTANGTRNNQGVILNVESNATKMSLIWSTFPSGLVENPQMRKTIKVIIMEGTVVHIMYFMCVNRSVPAIAGAKLVVSERGDILSPK